MNEAPQQPERRWWQPDPSPRVEKIGCQLATIGAAIGLLLGLLYDRFVRAGIAAESPTGTNDYLPIITCAGLFFGTLIGAATGILVGYMKTRSRGK